MIKLRHQLFIVQILLSIILFIFLWFTYYSYNNQYTKDIDTYIDNELNLHKKEILSSMSNATKKLQKQKINFISIHKEILEILQKNPNEDLEKLKIKIKSEFLSSKVDVELYLIDKSYTIYKTTNPKDLGFNLSIITEAKNFLDKTTKNGKIYIADFVSTDALDMKYKLYSYSKLTDDIYLEIGFIDTTLINTMNSLLAEDTERSLIKVNLFSVSKNKTQYYYYHMQKNDNGKSKEEQYKEFKKINLTEKTDDKIINAIKSDSPIHIRNNNVHTIYTRIFNEDKFSVLGFKDIILKLDVDVSEKLKFMEDFKNTFIYTLFVVALFLIMIYFIIQIKFTQPIEKILNSIKNSKKIDDILISSTNNELSEISIVYNDLFDKLIAEIKLNKELSLTDALTKSYNRKAFDKNITENIALFKRYKTPFSLLLFDIDDFKMVNDTYGHIVGDKVLIRMVELINNNTRDTDILYRVGGEEFIIISKNSILLDATYLAEKLRKIIEESLSIIENKIITVSVGVTEVSENDNMDSIYKRVDDNLYSSKNSGKNRVTATL
ncbi:MAG: diguanylate cyclase [Arcobacteraceae bacterium]